MFVIEYATFYNQDAFNEELTTEGYHQGGLGEGVTTISSALWEILTGYNPIIPNGFTDSLGNQTGVVKTEALTDYKINSLNKSFDNTLWYSSNSTATRNSTNKSVVFSQIHFGNTTSRQILYCYHFNACGEYAFTVSGLADSGITLSFRQGSTVLQNITEDGSYTVTFDATNKDMRQVYAVVSEATGNKTCNIEIAVTTLPANVEIGIDVPSFSVNRYRGIEQPFGDIWDIVDGALGVVSVAGGEEKFYVTDHPNNYSDSDYSSMCYIGEMPNNGYIKSLNIGETAEIIPESTGANGTTYMTDYCYRGTAVTTYTLLFGGYANDGAGAGLGCFHGSGSVGWAGATGGCRVSLKIK